MSGFKSSQKRDVVFRATRLEVTVRMVNARTLIASEASKIQQRAVRQLFTNGVDLVSTPRLPAAKQMCP